MSGDAGRRPLSVAAIHATGGSVCRQPESSLRAPFQQPPPPRSSRQMHTVVVASIASVVSPTALRAPVNDRCTNYGCLADGSTGRIARRPSAICQRRVRLEPDGHPPPDSIIVPDKVYGDSGTTTVGVGEGWRKLRRSELVSRR